MYSFIYNYEEVLSPLIVFLVGLFMYKQIKPAEKQILRFSFISIILAIYAVYKGHIKHENNVFIYHAFAQVEFGFFLSYITSNQFLKKKISKLLMGFYLLFGLINIFWLDTIYKYNSLGMAISQIIILILCLNSILKIALSESDMLFYKLPSFWVITGFLLFAVIGSISSVMTNAVSLELYYSIWEVKVNGNILKQFFFIIALICSKNIKQ